MSAPPSLRFGFVGTGKISSAVVSGYCSDGGWKPVSVTISPRNAEKAKKLKANFPDLVTIASNNQEVVDNADVVFLGLLPDVAASEIPKLNFRSDQFIISMMATVVFEDLLKLVRLPADQVIRTVPLPPCSGRVGPILMYPLSSRGEELLKPIGTPVALDDEPKMKVLVSITGTISPFYELLNSTTQWCVDSGVKEESAGAFVGAFYSAMAAAGQTYPEGGYGEMAEEAATPGGLNEQAWGETRASGLFSRWTDALSNLLTRLGGSPPPAAPPAAKKSKSS